MDKIVIDTTTTARRVSDDGCMVMLLASLGTITALVAGLTAVIC